MKTLVILQLLPGHGTRTHSTWCLSWHQTWDCVQIGMINTRTISWNFLVPPTPSDSYPALAASLATMDLWRVWPIRDTICAMLIGIFVWTIWMPGMFCKVREFRTSTTIDRFQFNLSVSWFWRPYCVLSKFIKQLFPDWIIMKPSSLIEVLS